MKNISHCKLCEHHTVNFSTGIVCGLTDKKPSFTSTCLKAKFSHTAEQELTNLLVEEKNLLDNQKSILTKSTINFLGILLILGFLFAIFLYGYILIGVGVFTAGIVLTMKIFQDNISLRNKKRILNEKKQEVLFVLQLYRKTLKTDLEFYKVKGKYMVRRGGVNIF